MLILSGLFFSACYLVLVFSYSFNLFLVAFLLRTLGEVLSSGTLQAYVYDFLKEKGEEDKFERVWGKGNALRIFGIGLAILLGGFLSEISYEFALVLSSISVLMVSFIAFFWPEVETFKKTKESEYWFFLKRAFRKVADDKKLLKIMVYTALLLALLGSLDEFVDVYLGYLSFSRGTIGLLIGSFCFLQSLISSFAYKFKDKAWSLMNLSVVLTSIFLLMAYFFKGIFSAFGILFLGIVLEFCKVLKEGIIQREIESYQRATISSLNSFVMNVLPYQLLFGFLVNDYNFELAYLFFGIFILFYFVFSFSIDLGFSYKKRN